MIQVDSSKLEAIKVLLQHKKDSLGLKPGHAFDSMRLHTLGEMRNESMGYHDLVNSGFGNSFWDRFITGEWHPETLERQRAMIRTEFFRQFIFYILLGICIIAVIYFLYKYLKRRKKKDKELEKELLIYIRKSHRSYNTESKDSDQ